MTNELDPYTLPLYLWEWCYEDERDEPGEDIQDETDYDDEN
jgi:hypothetical protein